VSDWTKKKWTWLAEQKIQRAAAEKFCSSKHSTRVKYGEDSTTRDLHEHVRCRHGAGTGEGWKKYPPASQVLFRLPQCSEPVVPTTDNQYSVTVFPWEFVRRHQRRGQLLPRTEIAVGCSWYNEKLTTSSFVIALPHYTVILFPRSSMDSVLHPKLPHAQRLAQVTTYFAARETLSGFWLE